MNLNLHEIFKKDWENIQDLKDYVEKYTVSFNQGFFTKVYEIDGKILKINCGDPDYAFDHYYEYFKNKNNIHAPVIYKYKKINNHYYCLTEKLINFPNFDPEHIGITSLRNLIKGNTSDIKLDDFTFSQVNGIYDFIKDLNLENFSIDICQFNIMLRENTWVLNDPIVKINA